MLLSKDAIKAEYDSLTKSLKFCYIDQSLAFSICYMEMQESIEGWVMCLSSELQQANVVAMPSYAFIHYLAHTHFPFDFVERIEDAEQIDRELRFGLVMPVTFQLEQESESSGYTKINPYMMVVEDVFRLGVDESFAPAINVSQLSARLADKPFLKWTEEIDNYEELIFKEIVRCAEALCMAVSRVASDALSLQDDKAEVA
ncbi:hypothetical protein ACP3V3_02770 [Vibrio sp. PNB22_3_1]